MKSSRIIPGVILLLAASAAAGEKRGPARPELRTLKQKASYGLGLGAGRNFKDRKVDPETTALGVGHAVAGLVTELPLMSKPEIEGYALGRDIGDDLKLHKVPDIDLAAHSRGLWDGMAGAPPLLPEPVWRQAVRDYLQKGGDLSLPPTSAIPAEVPLAERNRADGTAYQAANARKPGVRTAPSGLQYQAIKSGDGPSPTSADTVTLHYRGTLIDGTEFDSSARRDKPLTVPVRNLIRGWTEALPMMKVGDRWRLVVPPGLAYGSKGTPDGRVGPDATLVFEIELLKVEGAAESPEPSP